MFCRDKHVFVATKFILVAASANDRTEEKTFEQARVNREPFRLTEPRLVPTVSVAIAFNSFSPGSALFSPAIFSSIAKKSRVKRNCF